MKRLVLGLFYALAALVLVAFTLANRNVVRVSLDPISADDPWLAMDLPVWLLVLSAIFVGLVIGWLVAYTQQAKWRRRARAAQERLAVARSEPRNMGGKPSASELIVAG